MKRFLSLAACVVVLATLAPPAAQASGPFFRFPLLSAIRDNRQARAFDARANLNVARANAAASAAVFADQAILFRAPVVAAPVFSAPATAGFVPHYESPVFLSSPAVGFSAAVGHCQY